MEIYEYLAVDSCLESDSECCDWWDCYTNKQDEYSTITGYSYWYIDIECVIDDTTGYGECIMDDMMCM